MNLFSKSMKTSVLIVNGSCCMPQMVPLEAQARQIVEKVIAEERADVEIRTMTMSEAYYGGLPRSMVASLMDQFRQTGDIGLPAVLVNGEVATTGVPDPERLRAALRNAQRGGEVIPDGRR